jgi:hypothetical protein
MQNSRGLVAAGGNLKFDRFSQEFSYLKKSSGFGPTIPLSLGPFALDFVIGAVIGKFISAQADSKV